MKIPAWLKLRSCFPNAYSRTVFRELEFGVLELIRSKMLSWSVPLHELFGPVFPSERDVNIDLACKVIFFLLTFTFQMDLIQRLSRVISLSLFFIQFIFIINFIIFFGI
jgi:hypothetical protein